MSNPAALTYRRQYYDAGDKSGIECSLCGREIRLVFILKDPDGSAVPVGHCCFQGFKEANPEVYEALIASLVLLRGQARDIKGDTKEQMNLANALGQEMVWKAVRHTARRAICGFRKSSGEREWLPKPLFDLHKALAERPRQDYRNPLSLARWYERHSAFMRERLSALT